MALARNATLGVERILSFWNVKRKLGGTLGSAF